MTAAISITQLRKSYGGGRFGGGGQNAVNGLDLTVQPGEIWALAGPNGAGKTTTLHCLMGLVLADSGEIRLFGNSPTVPQTRARVGFQSEIFYSYPQLSAAMCLDFYGRLSGLRGPDLKARIAQALQSVGLGENLGQGGCKRVGNFSKGMQQRLGIAQSLLHDPDLYIWDEPTSGLDPEGRRLVVDLVKQLKERGKTVLLSTHVLPDIERVCDHVAIMNAGKLLLSGRIATLCEEQGKSLEDLYLSVMAGQPHA